MEEASGGRSIEGWARELRADDAIDARRQRAWRRQVDLEALGVVDVLLAHARAELPIGLETAAGGSYVATPVSVGGDHAGFRTGPARRDLVVRLDALFVLRPAFDTHGAPGVPRPDDGLRTDQSLSAALAELTYEGSHVTLRSARGRTARGGLRSVGSDVVVLESGSGDLVYVSTASISEISVAPSGWSAG